MLAAQLKQQLPGLATLSTKERTAALRPLSLVPPLRATSMAGLGGETFGSAGSFVPVRQPCLAPATLISR
ncbi:hypothetical protein PATSB16_36930 [Pandoraea thiooxydans]|nr:hypothetical protein PATSB16_36930 [Pandoraea thiooxydans]